MTFQYIIHRALHLMGLALLNERMKYGFQHVIRELNILFYIIIVIIVLYYLFLRCDKAHYLSQQHFRQEDLAPVSSSPISRNYLDSCYSDAPPQPDEVSKSQERWGQNRSHPLH
jgi:hypothetical protein